MRIYSTDMGLNETLDRLAKEREEREADKAVVFTEDNSEEIACNIPQLDEWELNITMAALRQYRKLNLQPFKADTYRQQKRKAFNRLKISTAIAKIRAAQRNDSDNVIQ